MAVRVNPFVSSLNTREYYHAKQTFKSLRAGVNGVESCVLNINGCCKPIPVFADLVNSADPYKNDFSSFILDVPTGNTVVSKLTYTDSSGNVSEYNVTNNNYGTLFALDTVRTGTWAFIIDWQKVASQIGFGCFVYTVTSFNSSARAQPQIVTPSYQLRPYSCLTANKTVRIETGQTGYIENGFDYRGIEANIPTLNGGLNRTSVWPQQFRWYGRFKADEPTLLTDRIVDSQRNEQQVQTQIIDNYTLRLDNIRANNSKPFFRNYLLANKILITDYNLNNIDDYREIRVNPVEVSERKNFPMNQNEYLTFTFEDYNKSTLKRH